MHVARRALLGPAASRRLGRGSEKGPFGYAFRNAAACSLAAACCPARASANHEACITIEQMSHGMKHPDGGTRAQLEPRPRRERASGAELRRRLAPEPCPHLGLQSVPLEARAPGVEVEGVGERLLSGGRRLGPERAATR